MSPLEKTVCIVRGCVVGYLAACLFSILRLADGAQAATNTAPPAPPALKPPSNLTALTVSIPVQPSLPATNRGSVTLAWVASPDPQTYGYRVYYGLSSTTNTDSARVGKVTKVTLNGLFEGVSYSFYVSSYDSVGYESPPSNFVDYTPPAAIYIRFGSVLIESYGVSGVTNLVQTSSDLKNWSNFTNFVGQPGKLASFPALLTDSTRFFRVIKAP